MCQPKGVRKTWVWILSKWENLTPDLSLSGDSNQSLVTQCVQSWIPKPPVHSLPRMPKLHQQRDCASSMVQGRLPSLRREVSLYSDLGRGPGTACLSQPPTPSTSCSSGRLVSPVYPIQCSDHGLQPSPFPHGSGLAQSWAQGTDLGCL